MTEHFGRVKPDDGWKRLYADRLRKTSTDHIYENADTIHIPSALWTSDVINDHKAIQQSQRLCETALQGRIQDFNLGDLNSVAEGHEGEGRGGSILLATGGGVWGEFYAPPQIFNIFFHFKCFVDEREWKRKGRGSPSPNPID